MNKIYKIPALIFTVLLAQLLITSSLYSATETINLETVLENLLSDEYSVSFEAEELEIFFSTSEPHITRYKTGKLKPYNMRREKYRIDGKVEEIIVQDKETQIIAYPEKGLVVRSFRENIFNSVEYFAEIISLIKQNYEFNVLGETFLSGRPVSIILIKSKDEGSRPSFKLWLDHEMKIPIKSETFNMDGSLLFLSSFSKITVNPSFPLDYFYVMVPSGTVAYDEINQKSISMPVSYKGKDRGTVNDLHGDSLPEDSLPGGYRLKDKWVDDSGNVQLLYHDGLNNISVFREDRDDKKVEYQENLHKACGPSKETVKEDGFVGVFCTRGTENIMTFILNKHRYIVVGRISKKGLTDIGEEFNRRINENDNH